MVVFACLDGNKAETVLALSPEFEGVVLIDGATDFTPLVRPLTAGSSTACYCPPGGSPLGTLAGIWRSNSPSESASKNKSRS